MVIRSIDGAAVAKDTIKIIPTIKRINPPLFRPSYTKDRFRIVLFFIDLIRCCRHYCSTSVFACCKLFYNFSWKSLLLYLLGAP